MLKEENNKKLFFKYRSINEHTKVNLKQNQLYFTNPVDFTDPFDSRTDLVYRGSREDWEYYLIKNGSKRSIDTLIKDKTLKRKGNELILNMNEKKFPHTEVRCGSDFGEEHFCRVSCFSKTYESILMWSHYADGHQGICLCFNSESFSDNSGSYLNIDSEKCGFYEVIYDKEMPKQLNMLFVNEWIKIAKFVTTKHTDWKYEKEYRIVLPRNSQNEVCIRKFPKENLEAIIFGLKIKKKEANEIFEIVRANYIQKGVNVKFYRVISIPGRYAIKIKPIESMDNFLNKLR